MIGRYWSATQRNELEQQLMQTQDVALFRRLLALLEIDAERSIAEVARELRVSRSTVHRWIERYEAEGKPKALERRPGQGRPRSWSKDLEELLESALAQPPLEIGYR